MIEELMELATREMAAYSNLRVCRARMKDILEAVRYTYRHSVASVDLGFRDALVSLPSNRLSYWGNEEEFLRLVEELPGFARDLVRHKANNC